MAYTITVVRASVTKPGKIRRERVECNTLAEVKYFIQNSGIANFCYQPFSQPHSIPADLSIQNYLLISGEESQADFSRAYDAAPAVKQAKFIPLDGQGKRRSRSWRAFFAHPGTWVGIGLAAIISSMVIGSIALAPLFGWIALIATVATIITLPFYIDRYITQLQAKAKLEGKSFWAVAKDTFKDWRTHHPFQVAIVVAGVAAFIIALILTIGFFTGGAGFAFMTPIFSAIATSLAANATVGSLVGVIGMPYLVPAVSVLLTPFSLALFSGLAFTLFPLNLANTLKRLGDWFNHKPLAIESEAKPILFTQHEGKITRVENQGQQPQRATTFTSTFNKITKEDSGSESDRMIPLEDEHKDRNTFTNT